MTLDLPYLAGALILLWLPRAWMRRGAIHGSHWHRSTQHRRGPLTQSGLDFRREFGRPRNLFDLARAALGTAALLYAFRADGDAGGLSVAVPLLPMQALGLELAIVLTGVLIQTLRIEHGRLSLTAPVFYLAGFTIAFAQPLAGAAAFALAWLLSPIIPNAQGFIAVQALVFGILAVLLGGLSVIPIAGAGICFLPTLLSVLMRRPLVVLSRQAASGGREQGA